jgi:F-type H+-transporting ATPase subunit epsilon
VSTTAPGVERKTLGVRLLTPEGPVYDGLAAMVVAPSVLGELGLLPRHAPIIADLRIGETRITTMDDEKLIFATTRGHLAVEEDQVLVLVEQGERADQIDRARAEAARARAQEAIAAAGDDEVARFRAESALMRAENRLRAVDKLR